MQCLLFRFRFSLSIFGAIKKGAQFSTLSTFFNLFSFMSTNVKKIALDSTKIRIPISLVYEISPEIVRTVMEVDAETSEYLSEYKKTSYLHQDKGISTFFKVETQQTRNGKEDFFTMLITSKILGTRYLEGITADNVKSVYDYIQALGLVKFTFNTFLNAEVTDTDFKKDFQNHLGKSLLSWLYDRTNPIKKGRGCTKFNEKTNQGIQWSDRKTTNFKTAPYWKVYNKHMDLQTKSKDFAEAFGIEVQEDYWRSEVTVKNKNHWKTNNVKDTTLGNILSLSQEQLGQFFINAHRAHVMIAPQRTKREGITPAHRLYYNAIVALMDTGKAYFEVMQLLLIDLEGANKTKKTDLLNTIYQEHIKGTPEGLKTVQIDATLEDMGIVFQ